MARIVETEQRKKKKKTKKIIIISSIIAVIVIALSVGLYLVFHDKKGPGNPVEVQILDENVDYGYSLSDRDGKLYKEEYNKLKKIIEADDVDIDEYTTQVAKMFIIDLYSMNTKLNMYDIGGSEFFHADRKDMYDSKVMDTIYSTMEDDTYGDRKQDLPMVKSIKVVNSEKTTYKLDDKEVDAYLVQLEWDYESSNNYDTKGSVVICAEGDLRWSVVDYQPTFNPKY